MPETQATVYPVDQLLSHSDLDVISGDDFPTLDRVFVERVRRSGDRIAFSDYEHAAGRWREYSWNDMAREVARWQAALRRDGLKRGDRVAIRLRNCHHWVVFDQAALGLGLVVVPLYVADRPENVNYVIEHADARLLFAADAEAWRELEAVDVDTSSLERVVLLDGHAGGSEKVVVLNDWLPRNAAEPASGNTEPDDLASIVYTSGTTGRPKGVMLSHRNMVANAYNGLRSIAIYPWDHMLSFLPLSHTLERTVGYYIPLLAGARISYARSIADLAEDLLKVRPTGVITVPRVFERVLNRIQTRLDAGPRWRRGLFNRAVAVGWRRFEHRQGRAPWTPALLLWPLLDLLVARRVRRLFGGRLRLAVVGGAPLPFPVARVFLAFDLHLLQGYGLTESSPSISINTLERNIPTSIGLPVHGVDVRIEENGQLLARGPNIMLGYWKNQAATDEVLQDGWLHTGDVARIDNGFITITGRIKDILVLANGEKIPPADMEAAIAEDPLFDQCMLVGEGMPYLTALVVLDEDVWRPLAKKLGVDHAVEAELNGERVQGILVDRIAQCIRDFPGYANIRRVHGTLEPWTIDNGLLTPTLKIKRAKIREKYAAAIDDMYAGHATYQDPVRKSA